MTSPTDPRAVDPTAGPERSTLPLGAWLEARRMLLDRGEACWLRALVDFDRRRMWAVDGQLSCVDWLMWRLQLSRALAFEKLRVAYALERRPLLAAAFDAGELSWSKVRALSRIDDPSPEVDQALVDLARVGSVRDVELAVRHYQLCADQDRAPNRTLLERRGVRTSRGLDGLGTIQATLDTLELGEFEAALRAFMDLSSAGDATAETRDTIGSECPARPAECPAKAVDQSRRVDVDVEADVDREGGGDADRDAAAEPVDESRRVDVDGDTAADPTPLWQRRADALMDLVRTAMAHRGCANGNGRAESSDRYLVHLIVNADTGVAEHLDGSPINSDAAAQVCCDSPTVTHVLGGRGESLWLGRKTRGWSTAQCRAITVRDGGTCRFPGCSNHLCDIHHVREWEQGGPTDVDNGMLLCRRHHRRVHQGFVATGDVEGAITFHRPDGTVLGATAPRRHFTGLTF